MDRKNMVKKVLAYAGIILFFVALSYAFVPQVLSDKVVNQSDISAWRGMTQETREWNALHPDDKTYWTDSMFGGMPNVAMYDDFEGDWTKPLYKLLMLGKRPANYLFVALLGAFLLLLALGVDKILAAGGAVAMAFCSYNMQIIQVGHNTKMQAIAFLPWVLAALVFTYRSAFCEKKGKWLPMTVLGSVLFALALSMQVKANHPQITYYLAIVIFVYAIGEAIWVCMKANRRLVGRFLAASGLLLAIGCVGIATNANKLLPTWKYTPETMRGGSELRSESKGGDDKGLDLDYATAWSYGIEETPNLLIPNFNGGSSAGKLSKDSETGQLLSQAGYRGRELQSTLESLPLYWGPQPFTAGPMYLGCICIWLFVLGLLLYKGREKWWLLIATLLAVCLAWGSHMMWFTRLWFDFAPLYNKFRTVSMALIILQVSVPALAFLVLDRILKGSYEKKELTRALGISYAITAGFCLIVWLFPGIAGNFESSVDGQLPAALAESLAADRRILTAHDAMRSFLFITIAACLLFWSLLAMAGKGEKENAKKNAFSQAGRAWIAAVAICVLVVFDLFSVGKRYLNDSHFVSKKDFSGQFGMRAVDEIILMDEDPCYRVLDMSVNTFNDAHPSYHHKCIGGYSPAKLQRYQDLIERHISPEIGRISKTIGDCETIRELEERLPAIPAISMLNGKYIIIGEDYPPVRNADAYGNAWLVEGCVAAKTPNEEIGLLGSTDLRAFAIVGEDFSGARAAFKPVPEGAEDSIELVSYAPNRLVYECSLASDRVAVFSEIYYPRGWKAVTDNGEELELFRADWTLRAAAIPAGTKSVTMVFKPESYTMGAGISRASSITLLLLLLLSCAGAAIPFRKD